MKAAFVAMKPAECFDWLDASDMARITQQALKLARAGCYPPKGTRFLDPGPWSGPAEFLDDLARVLVLLVQTEGHTKGIPGNEFAPGELSKWYSQDDAGSNNAQHPGAGRSPAMKGHGCPASPAGGPGGEFDQGVQGPCTPTAVLSAMESHS